MRYEYETYLVGQANANTGHGFAIFMASIGAMRSLRSLQRRLPWVLSSQNHLQKLGDI